MTGFINYNNILKSINPSEDYFNTLITQGISCNPVTYSVKEPNVYKRRIGRLYGSSMFNYFSDVKNITDAETVPNVFQKTLSTSNRIVNVQQMN